MSTRQFITIIEQACRRQGIALTIHSNGWLLELQKENTTRHIIGSTFDRNTHVSGMIARDKAATSALFEAASIDHIQHAVLKSANVDFVDTAALTSMLSYGSVVIKPLEGSGGNNIFRLDDAKDSAVLLNDRSVDAWAISPFIQVVKEIRVVVLRGRVKLVYEKYDPVLIDGLHFFNLSKGAKARRIDIHNMRKQDQETAIAAVNTLGLHVAAVDLVHTADGSTYVLEVNASFSLMRYAKINTATYNEVAVFYDHLVADLFTT